MDGIQNKCYCLIHTSVPTTTVIQRVAIDISITVLSQYGFGSTSQHTIGSIIKNSRLPSSENYYTVFYRRISLDPLDLVVKCIRPFSNDVIVNCIPELLKQIILLFIGWVRIRPRNCFDFIISKDTDHKDFRSRKCVSVRFESWIKIFTHDLT